MASRKLPPIDRIPSPPSSWMDLLAATTLDGSSADTLHVEVRGAVSESGPMRLVVQSWDELSARPLGSAQRAVTARELRDGVRLDLLEVRNAARAASSPKVVAWVEPGLPDLEFDGRTARPGPDHPIGVARGRAVTVVLRRPARVARTQRAA